VFEHKVVDNQREKNKINCIGPRWRERAPERAEEEGVGNSGPPFQNLDKIT